MKKRLVAFLLVLIMMLGMLPVSVFAENVDVGSNDTVINPVDNGSSGTVTPPDISQVKIWYSCDTGNEGARMPLSRVMKDNPTLTADKYIVEIDETKLCAILNQTSDHGEHSVKQINYLGTGGIFWTRNASGEWDSNFNSEYQLAARVELYSSTSSAKPSETAPEASRLPTIKFLCPSGCDHDASYLHPNETSMFSAGTRTDTTLEIVWNMDEILQAYQNSLTSNHLSTKNHQWRTVNGKSIDSLTLNWDPVEGAWTSPVLELNAYVQPVPVRPALP